jgi:dTDP-4-dehydrorhamnose 3,5-epimerase-like enzyme
MTSMLTPLQRIDTKDVAGNPNGWVVPIWRADSGEKIEQVYLTVVLPGTSKGPHLHHKRCGRFTCIQGGAEIITRDQDGRYASAQLTADQPSTFTVPPGVAAEIYCFTLEPAYLLNMPTPAWSAEDPDEWPVTDWNPA